MLNRAALIVRPAQPFLEWAASLDDSGLVPDVEGEQTVYLISEFEDDREERQILEDVYSEIFERELEGWHTDESQWPQKRTLAMFRNWFKLEIHSVVEDLCAYAVTNDET